MVANRYESSINAFFALVRAGLWEESGANLSLDLNDKVDWDGVYQLAEEQSVIGVVLVGIEHSNVKPSQEFLLQWIGEVQLLEQQNKAMNSFIAELIEKMRKADICSLLVKGQGIAQCYERPLWRSCGDVDLLFDEKNFKKAKSFFRPLVLSFDPDNEISKHINMQYYSWVVEIHENQDTVLSRKIDLTLKTIQHKTLAGGEIRFWDNNGETIILPSFDNDVLFVFTHIIKHFYKGGIGFRQICDWCRLLWTGREEIDQTLLESRLQEMGLINIWKTFAAFAVEYLGMPKEAMPLYSSEDNWKVKAKKILAFIMEVGNFGHNRDSNSSLDSPRLIKKFISMKRRCSDLIRHASIFPAESIKFFPYLFINSIKLAIQGE